MAFDNAERQIIAEKKPLDENIREKAQELKDPNKLGRNRTSHELESKVQIDMFFLIGLLLAVPNSANPILLSLENTRALATKTNKRGILCQLACYARVVFALNPPDSFFLSGLLIDAALSALRKLTCMEAPKHFSRAIIGHCQVCGLEHSLERRQIGREKILEGGAQADRTQRAGQSERSERRAHFSTAQKVFLRALDAADGSRTPDSTSNTDTTASGSKRGSLEMSGPVSESTASQSASQSTAVTHQALVNQQPAIKSQSINSSYSSGAGQPAASNQESVNQQTVNQQTVNQKPVNQQPVNQQLAISQSVAD